MNELETHAQAAYDSLRTARGEFDFFALLEPQESPGQWDLLVSAPWLGDTLADYEAIWKEFQKHLTRSEFNAIDRTMIVPGDYKPIETLVGDPRTRAKVPIEMEDFDFSGVKIKRGYILRVDRSKARRPARRRR